MTVPVNDVHPLSAARRGIGSARMCGLPVLRQRRLRPDTLDRPWKWGDGGPRWLDSDWQPWEDVFDLRAWYDGLLNAAAPTFAPIILSQLVREGRGEHDRREFEVAHAQAFDRAVRLLRETHN